VAAVSVKPLALRPRANYTISWYTRAVRSHLRSYWKLILTILISTLASQIPGLITPFFGPVKALWALTIRVLAGFETLAGNILGPMLDAQLARGIRESSLGQIRVSILRSKYSGGLLSLVSVLVTLTIGFLSGLLTQIATLIGSGLSASVACLISGVLIASTGRIFYLLGQEDVKFKIEILRGLLSLAAVMVPVLELRIYLIGFALTAGFSVYWFGLLFAVNSTTKALARAQD